MKSGDVCQCCGSGRMTCYKTRTHSDIRVRYLRCSDRDCAERGKEILKSIFLPLYQFGNSITGFIPETIDNSNNEDKS